MTNDVEAKYPPSDPFRSDIRVIGLVGFAHGVSHFSHLLLTPFFPVFMREFGLDFADVGFLVSVFFVVSGVGQSLSGFLVDRVGARPVLFTSFALFTVAAVLASVAASYEQLVAVALLAGLGNAPFHPVDFSIINQNVSSQRLGYAYSAHGISGNVGWAVAPLFLVGISALGDWRFAYQCAAGFYALVMLFFWSQKAHLKTRPVTQSSGHQTGSAYAYLKLPSVWLCFTFFMLTTMTLAVVQTYAPSILQALHGVSFETSTLTVSAYMFAGAVGMLVGGVVAVRTPWSERVVAAAMACGAVLMFLAATGSLGSDGTLTALACAGFAIGVGGPSRDLMIKKATPPGATGRVYGTVYSGLDVGFALSPMVFGALMDRHWYAGTLFGAGVVLLLSVAVARSVGNLRHK